ncbi:MAG: ABC transporter ATP-binding protein [Treponema sp.]|jgi:simple sugar transport system ATP-binding protein|nr:ABC transporter ATP-binding protein [Treponema sp.]
MNDAHYCVELCNISKTYPGSVKKANNNISLCLRKGEILCIAGENGAGKTTLMKILCGMETPDTGEIFINGKKERITSPLAAKKLGIGMVHQHFMLFPEFTVAENIAMGEEPRKYWFFFDEKKARYNAEKALNTHNFAVKSAQKVKYLSQGEMQQVEICRVLQHNAQIIILDEPTAILTGQETRSLFKTLKNLASKGISVILITHKLHEIKQICERVAVLRKGELAGVRDTADIDEYEIARMMIGENYTAECEKTPERINTDAQAVIVFDNVTVRRKGQKRPLLENVSFQARRGEILGFAGIGGNGLGVIEAVLGGFLHASGGKIFNKGKDISSLGIRALRKQGLAYVPADRLRVASAREESIEENLIINRRDRFFKKMIIDKNAAREFSEQLAKDYSIDGANVNEKAAFLSGGNLQKLILAREINLLKDYIVFSEPTWGLDIASSNFIKKEIQALRDRGTAVILISTNLDEILSLADRIIVMYRGKTAGVFENTGAQVKSDIGNAMQGIGIKE